MPDLRRLRPLKSWAWVAGVASKLVDVFPSPPGSSCTLMFRNFRTLCSSQHKCSSELYVFLATPAQANSQAFLFQVPEPKRFRQNRQVHLGNCCSEALDKGSFRQLVLIPAIDPATVSHHPADQRVIRVQLGTQSRLCCVLKCASSLPECDCYVPWRPWSRGSPLAKASGVYFACVSPTLLGG